MFSILRSRKSALNSRFQLRFVFLTTAFHRECDFVGNVDNKIRRCIVDITGNALSCALDPFDDFGYYLIVKDVTQFVGWYLFAVMHEFEFCHFGLRFWRYFGTGDEVCTHTTPHSHRLANRARLQIPPFPDTKRRSSTVTRRTSPLQSCRSKWRVEYYEIIFGKSRAYDAMNRMYWRSSGFWGFGCKYSNPLSS